jgi:hypothetical protein
MKEKAILMSVVAATLSLTAAAIYFLVAQLQLNFLIAFLLVTGAFASITGVVMRLLRERITNKLIKLSKDRQEKLLNNYVRQLKLYKFILWQTPLYVLVFLLIYHYTPHMLQNLQIETIIEIVVIAIFYYLSTVLNLLNKKFVIKKLNEILL